MNEALSLPVDANIVWNRYRHTFSRHLLGVARYLQSSLMDTLQQQYGHSNLRLGFTPYISLIGAQGRRLTDIAQVLGISRQACNQAIKPIEAAGYIARTANLRDGRAKLLSLTPAGVKLRSDGMRIVSRLDKEFSQIAGDKTINDASKSLGKLYRHLALGLDAQTPNLGMGALLPALADYTLQRLMELTRAKGHPGLKLSFGQVLTLIGPSGGRIKQIAAVHDVSKQAISTIATELEEQGYLLRDADPLDARQIVLKLTVCGEDLIADSVASVEELETEFAAIIGQAALKRMKATLYELYRGLQLEREIFEKNNTADIDLLAKQLQQQLGEHGSQALARLLLSPTEYAR